MSKPRMYRISTAGMRETISRLRLEKGDVLLVRHPETLHYLARVPIKLEFNVPLVYCPGGVEILKRQDLLNLLEQLDQASVPNSPPVEQPSAPL